MGTVHIVYLPVVETCKHPILGAQLEGVSLGENEKYIVGNWVSVGVNWNWAEAERGQYQVKQLLADLDGYHLIVNVRNAPVWARSGELECSGVKPENYQDYASFILYLIEEYPYIEAVELWNEPDAYHTDPVLAQYFGCFESGEIYAEMVNAVAPILKAQYPDVTVVAGALLDTGQFAIDFTGNSTAYNVLSFHHYAWYGAEWDTQQVALEMRTYTDKPVWMTETSLLCVGSLCNADFEQAQADYYDYMIRSGPDLIMWYTLANNGWNNSDLVDNDRRRPAWYRYEEWATWEEPK
jgi:hypothetical protein